VNQQGASAVASFISLPMTPYQFEFTPELNPPTWNPVGGVVLGSGNTTFTSVPMPNRRGFFRYSIVP